MSHLYDAAKGVLANWERGDLAAAVRYLQSAVDAHEEALASPEEIQRATDEHGSNGVNIDSDATTSRSEDGDGCWVSAWVWIYSPESDDTEGGGCD